MKALRVPVGEQPALIVVGRGNDQKVIIRNLSRRHAVYVGGKAVTADEGFHVAPDEALPWFHMHQGEEIWAVCSVGQTSVVSVLVGGTV